MERIVSLHTQGQENGIAQSEKIQSLIREVIVL